MGYKTKQSSQKLNLNDYGTLKDMFIVHIHQGNITQNLIAMRMVNIHKTVTAHDAIM